MEAPQRLNPQRDGQLDPVWLSGEPSQDGAGPSSGMGNERQEAIAANALKGPGTPRRHGSALPRPS